MDLVLTGSGPASGFPVPGCSCATCRTATGSRRPAELRVDDRYRLDVDGVLHEDGGTWHPLRPGARLDLPGIGVRPLATAGAPICLLIDPDDGPPVLWAPQGGPLADDLATALAGAVLGTVFLGPAPETDPDRLQVGPAPVECALALARLRAGGAVDDRTRSLFVGLGHRLGPADRLATSRAHWRVEIPADDTQAPSVPAGPAVRTGRTLVLGGSASGKSGLAEDLLAAEPDVLYVATGPILDLRTAPDADWAQRVRRHRDRRPTWWRTEETHLVAAVLAENEGPVLLDSVGTWLTGVLDRAGAWHDQHGWRARVGAENDALVRAWRARTGPLVAVSDEVGLGVVPPTPAGRLFREELGRLNRRLAEESEQVHFVVAGRLLASPVDPQ